VLNKYPGAQTVQALSVHSKQNENPRDKQDTQVWSVVFKKKVSAQTKQFTLSHAKQLDHTDKGNLDEHREQFTPLK
jgi:hypothetical protein